MHVRIEKAISGILDGVSLSQLVPGLVYDLPDSLGKQLEALGAVRPVPIVRPSLVLPLNDGIFTETEHFTGGVNIEPRETADDRPRRLRRRRR
jgi:hypothetical protein